MRACVDTSIPISYLLSPASDRPPSLIVRGALRGEFSLVTPETTLSELREKVQGKRYLTDRITADSVDLLVGALRAVADVHPLPSEPLPRVVRDPRDDYLLAPAVLERVHYLVTGDNDLLVPGEFQGVGMVAPATFAGILESEEEA